MTTKARSGASSIHVALGLALGVILGALFGSIASQTQEQVPAAIESNAESQLHSLVQAVVGLENAIRRLEQKTEQARVPSSAGGAQAPHEAARAPVELNAERETLPTTDPSAWVSVLDPAVARALVERGLTPFDNGVAELVLDAGTALREADARYSRAMSPVLDDFENDVIGLDEFKTARAPIARRRDVERDEVISEFVSRIESLGPDSRDD